MIDEEITVNGKRWRKVGEESYVRLDGIHTILVLWEGRCRHCDKPFIVKSTRRGRGCGSKVFVITPVAQLPSQWLLNNGTV